MTIFAERVSVEQVELGAELAPRFDPDGLLPAIVVDCTSGEVLMLGYMNPEALERTIATGEAHYWSRSRKAIWRKGEHSGFTQQVVSMLIDDDQDAVILRVRLSGPGSCHVGYRSCFYRELVLPATGNTPIGLRMIETDQAFDASTIYAGLENPTRL